MGEARYALSSCLSHPDQALTDHLVAVAHAVVNQHPPRADADEVKRALLSAARWCALVHDVGKATEFFQTYIRGGPDAGSLRHHSQLSALFAHAGLLTLLTHHDLPEDLRTLLTCGETLSVWRHHGDLYDLEDMVRDFTDGVSDHLDGVLPRQLAALPLAEVNDWLSEQWRRLDLPGEWQSVSAADLLGPFEGTRVRRRWRKLAQTLANDMRHPLGFLMHYSLLIGHDKLQAALRDERPTTDAAVTGGIVDAYRRDRFGTPHSDIDRLRARMSSSVASALSQASDGCIFTLTAPTGSGKTLVGLEAALRLRERKRANWPGAPVIYCLPFTSIIDQNFDVMADLLQHAGLPTTSDTLLKHHHLADAGYVTSERRYDLDESSLLIEEWMSSIVVTTFEQFFRTLYAARNASLKRLHRLRGAVVLLDEVQAIPRRYWETVRLTLLQLARDWEMDVLLMTATRPLILQAEDCVELVSNQQELFGALSRVTLHNRSQQETELRDFIEQVSDQIASQPERSTGVVVNTVACARRVYRELAARFPDRRTAYLSSHIVPLDRRERIRRLREDGTSGTLVSTQVIEAGVDISLDVIHRDFAPLDSIIQTAGRCNRNAEDEGAVVLWRLRDSERYRRPFCRMIYDPLLLDATDRVLDGRDTLAEADFRTLGDAYFEDLKKRGADAELHREFAHLNFGTVAEKFQLIEELPGRQSYFVVLDGEAEQLWELYCRMQELPFAERRRAFAEIRRPFYERIINVARPEGEAANDVQPLYPDPALPVFYDRQCGFQEGDSDASMFF